MTKPCILVVDDDAAVRHSVDGVLGDDFELAMASSVNEAEALLRARAFDVLLTDYELGGARTGLELVKLTREVSPGTMIIVVTGHAELPELQKAESEQAVVRVLRKPYDPRRLTQLVANTVKLGALTRAMRDLEKRRER